jgi:hypothetical protein
MAPDLLSTICDEIDQRLKELRPLLAEYEHLLGAAGALVATDREEAATAQTSSPAKRARGRTRVGAARRGSAAGAIERAAAGPAKVEVEVERELDEGSTTRPHAADAQTVTTPRRRAAKPKPARAARGAAREAILGALEHGSHTVAELAVVTAMSGPNISGNLRRLSLEGVVVKTEREGKTAWSLAEPAF